MILSDDCDDWPKPGPNKPAPAWNEYKQLEQAVNDYLDRESEDLSWNDIWRALAAIMGEYQQDSLVVSFDFSQSAEMPCVHRLITGGEECTSAEKTWLGGA